MDQQQLQSLQRRSANRRSKGARYNQLVSKVAESLLSDPVGTVEQLEMHRNGYTIFSDVVDFIDERRVASGNMHVDAGWENVKNWGKNKLDKAKNWGKGKMQDAWNGIKSAPGKAVDAITPQWMSDIWNYQDPNALPAPNQGTNNYYDQALLGQGVPAGMGQNTFVPNMNQQMDWSAPAQPMPTQPQGAQPSTGQVPSMQTLQPIPADQRNPKKDKAKGIQPNYPAGYDPSAWLPQSTAPAGPPVATPPAAPSRPVAPPPSATAPVVPNPSAPAAEQFSPKTMEDWFSGLDTEYSAKGVPTKPPVQPTVPTATEAPYDPNKDIQDVLGLSPSTPTQDNAAPTENSTPLADDWFNEELKSNPYNQPAATPADGSPEETEAWANGIGEQYGPQQQEVPGVQVEDAPPEPDAGYLMPPDQTPGVTPESQKQLQEDEQQIALPFGNAQAKRRAELETTRNALLDRGRRRLMKVRGY